MATLHEDPQWCKDEVELSSQLAQEQEDQRSQVESDAAATESCSGENSKGNFQNVSFKDLQLVQNLIERCLQLYMNQGEVVKTLLNQAKIEPVFTSLVWQKLEEQNQEFFKAYYTRLKLKKQIILFNHLLEQQCQIMRLQGLPTAPLTSMQNGMHPSSFHHLPMGYPVFQQSLFPVTGHTHIDSMSSGEPSPPVVKGVPVEVNFQSNAGSPIADSIADNSMQVSPVIHSPGSGSFPFHSVDMSGIGMSLMPLDVQFISGDTVATNGAGTLEVASDAAGSSIRDSLRSLGPLPRNFSLSDLTTDLTKEDLGPLGSYSGPTFMPLETGIFLESPDKDEIDEEFFLDSITEPFSQSDDEE